MLRIFMLLLSGFANAAPVGVPELIEQVRTKLQLSHVESISCADINESDCTEGLKTLLTINETFPELALSTLVLSDRHHADQEVTVGGTLAILFSRSTNELADSLKSAALIDYRELPRLKAQIYRDTGLHVEQPSVLLRESKHVSLRELFTGLKTMLKVRFVSQDLQTLQKFHIVVSRAFDDSYFSYGVDEFGPEIHVSFDASADLIVSQLLDFSEKYNRFTEVSKLVDRRFFGEVSCALSGEHTIGGCLAGVKNLAAVKIPGDCSSLNVEDATVADMLDIHYGENGKIIQFYFPPSASPDQIIQYLCYHSH